MNEFQPHLTFALVGHRSAHVCVFFDGFTYMLHGHIIVRRHRENEKNRVMRAKKPFFLHRFTAKRNVAMCLYNLTIDHFRFTMNTEHLSQSDQQEKIENNDYAPKQQIPSSSTSNETTLLDQPQRSDPSISDNNMTILTPSERRERIWTLCVIALIALLTGLSSFDVTRRTTVVLFA